MPWETYHNLGPCISAGALLDSHFSYPIGWSVVDCRPVEGSPSAGSGLCHGSFFKGEGGGGGNCGHNGLFRVTTNVLASRRPRVRREGERDPLGERDTSVFGSSGLPLAQRALEGGSGSS